MTAKSFSTTVMPQARGGGTVILLPFDPNLVWGDRDRHHVAGTIQGHGVRGAISRDGEAFVLKLGPAWCRADDIAPGAMVNVELAPEGPQMHELPAELAAALGGDAAARRFFESLPTFYRKGFVRPISEAKRPATRARRAQEAVVALAAGRRTP